MEHNRQRSAALTSSSPYLYDVDPGLHDSQKPSEVPRVKRNLVQNLVAQFNKEAQNREFRRHHSVDDSFGSNGEGGRVSSTSPGFIEATSDNAPNHNQPFSYTLGNNNNNNGGINNSDRHKSSSLGPRSRSDYNIQTQPSEVIYAHVVVNSHEGSGKEKGSVGGKRKTTIHTAVPNRMVSSFGDSSKKPFAKSTGSLNMSAHEEEVDDEANRKFRQLKDRDQSYYRYSEVDENIRQGTSDRRQRRQLLNGHHNDLWSTADVVRDNSHDRQAVPVPSRKEDGDYETRNVERWSEKEDGPNSRKFTEHEFIHEVSVSHDGKVVPPVSKDVKPHVFREPLSSLHRNKELDFWEFGKKRQTMHSASTGELRRATELGRSSSEERHKRTPEMKRYFFGENDDEKLEKPSRQKWSPKETNGWSTAAVKSYRGTRRSSDDSGTSSGVGLLSSKLVKKANARVGGIESGEDTVDFSNRRRRMSEGDDDVFPSFASDVRRDPDDGRVVRYDWSSPRAHANDYSTESRKVFRREETTHTTKRRTRHTRSHGHSEDEDREDEENVGKTAERQRTRVELGGGDRSRLVRSTSPEVRNGTIHRQNGSFQTTMKSEKEDQRHRQHRTTERRVDIEIGEKTRSSSSRHHNQEQVTSGDSVFNREEQEDKMETSESEPPLYGGSQESRMSLGSRQSSVDDEAEQVDNRLKSEEDIIAAHVNTPQSLIRQMDRRQINYENSQHQQHRETTSNAGRRFWFERSRDDADDGDSRDRMTTNRNVDTNKNHYHQHNNNQWTSATLGRLESNKNHRNGTEDRRWQANTVDRRDVRRRKGAMENVRIQLNDRDIDDVNVERGVGGHVGRSSSFSSRVGSYHSENESQNSAGSASSSRNGSPAKPKRVNFKSKSPPSSGRIYGGGASLSPVHREALLRSASPARAPSTTGSVKSTESDGSPKSVILHATAVADIPPTRQYRIRSANTSPSPPASSIGGTKSKESRTISRSFSLLSPWKPRKYKEKYEKRSMTNGSAPNIHQAYKEEQQERKAKSGKGGQQSQRATLERGDTVSQNSSSEKLDSLPPLPSEVKASKKKPKKKVGILRRHSMPKDSRFANFFRRKKDPKT